MNSVCGKAAVFLAVLWTALSCRLLAQPVAAAEAPIDDVSPMTFGTSSAVIGGLYGTFFNSGNTALRHKLEWNAFYDRSVPGKTAAGFFYSRRAVWGQQPFTWGSGVFYQYRKLVPQRLPAASSDDLILFFSLGKTFQGRNHLFAFGLSQKYWTSHFAQFSAANFLWDLGGVFRTGPIVLFRNTKGAVSLGAGLSQFGPQITWEGRHSEVPTTVRAGGSLAALWRERYALKCSIEYQHSAELGGFWGQGMEFNVAETIKLRVLRIYAPRAEQRWFVGADVSLHGMHKAIGTIFNQRDAVLQMDLTNAAAENRLKPVVVACSYYRNSPDPVVLSAPAYGDTLGGDRTLHWRPAFDADWFDTISYRVAVDGDSAAVSNAVRTFTEGSIAEKRENMLLIDRLCREPTFALPELMPGALYWTAAALDNRGHVSLSRMGLKPQRMVIPRPKVLLQKAEFIPVGRLGDDSLQGTLVLAVENLGENAHAVRLTVMEKGASAADALDEEIRHETRHVLPPGQSTVQLPWQTTAGGRRRLTFTVEPLFGKPYAVKPLTLEASTIPLARLYGDSLKTVHIKKRLAYLPLLRSVAFKGGSSELWEDYQSEDAVQPVLSILARRLKDNPHAVIHIVGMIDPDSGEEEISLAWRRARVVRDLLAKAGADTLQMRLSAQRHRKRSLPRNTKDLEWILQERRCVRFSAEPEDAELLFAPIQREIVEADPITLDLHIDFLSSLPAKMVVEWQADEGAAGVYLLRVDSLRQNLPLQWILAGDKAQKLAGNKLLYRLAVTDSLGRVFRSDFLPLRLLREETIVEQTFRIPFEFAKYEPDSLSGGIMLKRAASLAADRRSLDIQITGSACPIGPKEVNAKLARARAERIYRYLVDAINKTSPVAPANSKPGNHNDLIKLSGIDLSSPLKSSSPAQRNLLRFVEISFKASATL